jgi:hypothetical protein
MLGGQTMEVNEPPSFACPALRLPLGFSPLATVKAR